MIKKKIIISALVLTMCVGAASLTSCGRENSTTDGRGEGNQTTQTPNNNDNGGVIGEIGSDIGEGVGDMVDGVTGNGANGGNNGTTNGTENNGPTAPSNPTTPEGARMRSFPAGK